jgi:hypothetical protein
MHSSTRRVFFAVLMLCLAGSAFGQSVNSTMGSVSGVVKDSTGAALPGVTVTATNLGTGLNRTTVTEGEGTYVLNLLPPGTYKVDAELAGLGTASAASVNVLLGNSTKVDLIISPQVVTEEITVTAAAPVVDTSRTGTAISVTEQQIDSLPILTRDFRALAQLTPGVVPTFGNRITSNGARGISTDYNIDGASSNNDFFGEQTGGTRAPFTFSQAAVREFQVVRSQYDAEYGRGVGATLNAITKSGSNDLEGEVFYYLRNKDWASSRPNNFPSNQTATDSFVAKDSSQPGFALGGPVLRDRLFYFVNYDGQSQNQPINATNITANAAFTALPAETRTAFLTKIQTLIGFPYEEGLQYEQSFDQKTYLIKFDLNAGAKNHFSLRDNYSNFENANNQSFNHLSNQGVENDKFNQLVLQGESVFSNSMFNQLIVQYSTDERPISPRTTTPEVAITYAPGQTVFLGQNDFLPNNTKEKKIQVKNTLSYVWNAHTFKGGVEALLVSIDNLFPRNLNGVFRYNSVADFVNDRPNSFNQGFGPGGGLTSWDQDTYALYASDSFRVGARWNFDIGLRYDWQTMPEPETNAFPQHPEFVSQIEEDHNLAPRLGFAFDVLGNGRSVVRGGTGKFFSYMPSILLSNPLTQISGNFSQVSISNCNATTNVVPCPAYPNLLSPAQFGQLARVGTDIVTIGPDYEAQEAWRSSLQFEQQIGSTYSAAAGLIYQKTTKVQGTRNINLVPAGFSFGDLPIYTTNSPNRRYNDMGVVRELFSDEESSYNALTLETHKLAINQSNFSWDLSYTLAEATDQDSNERSTSTSFLYDPNNLDLSEGPSDSDIRHRVVGDFTYRLPWGFTVSAIGSWRTGTPFTRGNAFTGAMNINGITQTSGNIPVFVNSEGQIIDMAAFASGGKTRAEIAAFLSSQGARIIGRNTERQPDVWSADLRLAKTFGLPRGFEVELLGEVFNVFNTRNRTIGTANQTMFSWAYTAATDRYVITPVNFSDGTPRFGVESGYDTSVDPRQLQVAAKIRF